MTLLGAALSFLGPLLLYFFTAVPTVPLGDSGELITAACTLGIPHPPGFPIYCLLGKLFCFLPWGSPAWRINVMSGFFGAATCLTLYVCLKHLNIRTVVALGTAWFLATSKLFWLDSIEAEVYTLHTFFLGILFYGALHYRSQPTPKKLYLLFFLWGLSLTNHWPLVILSTPPLLWILFEPLRKNLVSWRAFLKLTVSRFLPFVLLGLLPYLYLPLRSRVHPPIDWGHTHSLYGFFIHVLRLTTSESDPGWQWSDSLKLLRYFGVEVLGRNFMWVGFPLALWGLETSWSHQRTIGIACLIGFLSISVTILLWVRVPWTGINADAVVVTFLPACYFLALLMGLGLEEGLTKVEQILAQAHRLD